MPIRSPDPWICPICKLASTARFVLSMDGKPATLAGFAPEACFRCAATLSQQLPRYISLSAARLPSRLPVRRQTA
jgi:hypothetical protein